MNRRGKERKRGGGGQKSKFKEIGYWRKGKKRRKGIQR